MPAREPFPECILDVLVTRFKTIDGVSEVFKRDLAPTDPNGSIGACFEMWSPVATEMSGGYGPTISAYAIQITHLVKHSEREPGAKQHRSVARAIRSMLYQDPTTTLSLRQLTHTDPAYTERMMKWELEQRFASNQIERAFYFVSETTATFQTETV